MECVKNKCVAPHAIACHDILLPEGGDVYFAAFGEPGRNVLSVGKDFLLLGMGGYGQQQGQQERKEGRSHWKRIIDNKPRYNYC